MYILYVYIYICVYVRPCCVQRCLDLALTEAGEAWNFTTGTRSGVSSAMAVLGGTMGSTAGGVCGALAGGAVGMVPALP